MANSNVTTVSLYGLFNEIGNAAYNLKAIMEELSNSIDADEFYGLLPAVQKIGYLADLGSQQVGGIQVAGGAENGFLQPLCCPDASSHVDTDSPDPSYA